MRAFAKRIAADDRAQDLPEYGIALAVIGAVAISAAIIIGTNIGSIWNPVDSVVSVVHGHSGQHGNGNGNGNHGNGNGNGNGNS
jgi:Flp pilus assembly pilin Flp